MKLDLKEPIFDRKVHQIAYNLKNILNGSDKLALLPPTSHESIMVILAAMKLGLKLFLCNIREPNNSTSSWLLMNDVNHVVVLGKEKITDFTQNVISFNELIDETKGFQKLSCQRKHFVSVMKTSGTTGIYPKSAQINFQAHMASAQSVADYFSLTSKHIFGLNLPLYHVSGFSILMRALASNCRINVINGYENLKKSIQEKVVTHLSLVPYTLQKLYEEQVELLELKAIFVGGDKLPKFLANNLVKQNVQLFESYGMTETASTIMIKKVSEQPSFFHPLKHVSAKLSQKGELLIKSSALFSGYLHDPQKISKDSFFNTKDLFYVKGAGFEFLGRSKNVMVSGGENINPEEVESVLNHHPLIERSIVVAKSCKKFGSRPVAFIDAPYVPLNTRAFVANHLPFFKVPEEVYLWPKILPANPKLWRKYMEGLV